MIQTEEAGIRYLTEQNVRDACVEMDPVAVIREAFRLHACGETTLPDEAYLPWKNSLGERLRSLNMPAYVGGFIDAAGTKIINANPRNPSRGLPRADGLTILFDNGSGRIACVMQGAYLSSLRTASVSTLAVELFQWTHPTIIAVIGAGVLARAHIKLLLERLRGPIEVRLFDLDRARLEAFRDSLAPLAEGRSTSLYLAESAEDAIRPAQVVIPVTTTTTGYIALEWLQPGSLLVNVSLDDPLPEVVLGAGKVFVDDWNLVKNDPRRLLGRMFREGIVVGPGEQAAGAARAMDGELGDVVIGRNPGRTNAEEVIMINPLGLAIEDVALASCVYRVSRELGLGRCLPR